MATGRIPGTSGSPLTAKGDIFAYSTTASRLPVGSDGQTLVANSAATTGLQWTSTPSASNPVLNSAMQVWQRATSFAFNANAAYTADRWYATVQNTAATISRQNTSDTTNLPNIQYCMRLSRNSATTNTGNIAATQSFETINSIPFAGKTVTLSFYARAGANFSAASSAISVYLITGTGTDQNQASGYTGQALPINSSATLTTTWQRFTYTGTIAATATEIATQFLFTPVGTAGAADYFEVTGVQIDVASVALPFRTFSQTLQGELAACRRYLPTIENTAATAQDSVIGYALAANYAIYYYGFDVIARVPPTGITATGTIQGYGLNTAYTFTPAFNSGTPNGVSITAASGVTIVAGQGSRIILGAGAKILFTGCEL